MLIQTDEELEKFLCEVETSDILAVDTEFLRETTYYPKLCLVQISDGKLIGAIDVLSCTDFTHLIKLLEDKAITKIMHACQQDLECLYADFGAHTAPVFDTQLAAGFVGYKFNISLANLVEAYTGQHLKKTETLTDWSMRPLRREQVIYAEDDVRYLPVVYRKMYEKLVSMKRLPWVFAEMEGRTRTDIFDKKPNDAYIHLRHVQNLNKKQLSVAKSLCAWREVRAQKLNVPVRRVLSDETVYALSIKMPRLKAELYAVRGTNNLSAHDVDTLLRMISEAKTRKIDYPWHVDDQDTHFVSSEAVDLAYAVMALVCNRKKVDPQMVSSKHELKEFLSGNESARLSHGWRREVAGKFLHHLMDGEIAVTIKHGMIELI